jgi:transcriptional regulator with XRE-family HTH domain
MDARRWLADNFYGAEGDTARLIRLRKGLSLEHVAAKVGISRDTLARLENGAGSLGERSTARLTAVLGADPRALIPAKRRQRAASRRPGR